MSIEDIVHRRMQNTSETREEAVAAISKVLVADLVDSLDQSWVAEWIAPVEVDESAIDVDSEAVRWMQSRPPVIQALMLRFPPSCVVRATGYHIPREGTVGIVHSYFEGGEVSVRQSPYADHSAMCDPDRLEVVGYCNGWTPERVRLVLDLGKR